MFLFRVSFLLTLLTFPSSVLGEYTVSPVLIDIDLTTLKPPPTATDSGEVLEFDRVTRPPLYRPPKANITLDSLLANQTAYDNEVQTDSAIIGNLAVFPGITLAQQEVDSLHLTRLVILVLFITFT
jgi:hypothetical protein